MRTELGRRGIAGRCERRVLRPVLPVSHPRRGPRASPHGPRRRQRHLQDDRIRHRPDRALPRRAPLRAVRPPARIPPQHGAPARRTRPRRTARRRRPRHDRRLPPLPRDVERGPSLRSLRPQPGRARSLRGHASLPRDRRGSRLRRGLPPRTPFHDSRQDPGGLRRPCDSSRDGRG